MHGHTCSEPVSIIAKFSRGLAPVFSFAPYLILSAAPSAITISSTPLPLQPLPQLYQLISF